MLNRQFYPLSAEEKKENAVFMCKILSGMCILICLILSYALFSSKLDIATKIVSMITCCTGPIILILVLKNWKKEIAK
jgi:hypothetical protein